MSLRNGIKKLKKGRREAAEVPPAEEAGLEVEGGLAGSVETISGKRHNKPSLPLLA